MVNDGRSEAGPGQLYAAVVMAAMLWFSAKFVAVVFNKPFSPRELSTQSDPHPHPGHE